MSEWQEISVLGFDGPSFAKGDLRLLSAWDEIESVSYLDFRLFHRVDDDGTLVGRIDGKSKLILECDCEHEVAAVETAKKWADDVLDSFR